MTTDPIAAQQPQLLCLEPACRAVGELCSAAPRCGAAFHFIIGLETGKLGERQYEKGLKWEMLRIRPPFCEVSRPFIFFFFFNISSSFCLCDLMSVGVFLLIGDK